MERMKAYRSRPEDKRNFPRACKKTKVEPVPLLDIRQKHLVVVAKMEADKYFGMNEFKEAKLFYTKAINVAPKVPHNLIVKCYGNRAYCYMKMFYCNSAISDMEMVMKLDPEHKWFPSFPYYNQLIQWRSWVEKDGTIAVIDRKHMPKGAPDIKGKYFYFEAMDLGLPL